MAAGPEDDRYKVATWRSRAEQLRSIAETFQYPETPAMLVKMASEYENIPARGELEARQGAQKSSFSPTLN